MKYKKRIITIAASLVIIAALTVGSTIAWLSDKSDTIVNTFNGQSITVIVEESPVDDSGKITTGSKTTGNDYTFVAGSVLDKDPTATVKKGSAKSYVYLYIDNNLASYTTLNIDETNWALVESGVYRYIGGSDGGVVDAKDADVELPAIFTTVTFNTDIEADDIAIINAMPDNTIEVTAFAVQSENITIAEADKLAVEAFTATP
ncbi:MAG: hypothetical protein LUF33_00950 [Clostridiales bacterium]|nr:hypothetical protein [Clostridiales bacterium]